ncbi:MAG: hypothetical protein AAFY20_22745 [Cyanobacteria bacterium J06639_14]
MKAIQTTFPEIHYETPEAARAARDEQVAQLEAKGVSCHRETLYRATDGRYVFVITINDTEDIQREIPAPIARSDRATRPRKPRDTSRPVEYR